MSFKCEAPAGWAECREEQWKGSAQGAAVGYQPSSGPTSAACPLIENMQTPAAWGCDTKPTSYVQGSNQFTEQLL